MNYSYPSPLRCAYMRKDENLFLRLLKLNADANEYNFDYKLKHKSLMNLAYIEGKFYS